ncbi:MAG: hypothetical protein E6R03_08490 [Hyphomicrobiaceae bacterium]|nr:MAG: hypothetical protein E6R03_08490 [Hyphomicrobiaceae bacterium]
MEVSEESTATAHIPRVLTGEMKNALDSLYNGGLTGQRIQTVLTPQAILEPLRTVFGGPIGMDPVWAPGSLTEPLVKVELPWDVLWARVEELAGDLAYPNIITSDPGAPEKAIQLLRSEIRTKEAGPLAVALAKLVKAQIRAEYGSLSGHMADWPDRTYCNPPFGNQGPEVLLADFKDFCAKYAKTQTEVALLSPARSHRKWWRKNVMMASTAVVYLNPLRFEGFPQTFPAPLVLAYRGPHAKVELLAREFAHMGDTVEM